MNDIVNCAISSVNKGINAFCKFISANDAGKTGGHQEGFYIPKNSIPLMFDNPGIKGQNKERFITIKWQNDFETKSRFIYYGQGTRNEYRLTRFGRGFPFLTENNVGDLFILIQIDSVYYEGFVLQTDEDIEDFFVANNISANETNRLIEKKVSISPEDLIYQYFNNYIDTLTSDFPSTYELAETARQGYLNAYNIPVEKIKANPDAQILNWLDSEFKLFKTIENKRYSDLIKSPFKSVEQLVECANTILNRRKSRAGKSLEHHLAEIFNTFKLEYESQAITEDNKKPDFIFPNSRSYHDLSFPESKLSILASKTTCKDRWRQVLNEADRVKQKHLFTLQQGISKNQLEEMYKYGIQLVVPKPYIKTFPIEFHSKIQSLDGFISYIDATQKMIILI